MSDTRENQENVIRKWTAAIREASSEALNEALPDVDRDSVAYIKLQMLMRITLLDEAKQCILNAGDADADELDTIIYEMKPELIEELIVPTASVEMQRELAIALNRYLKEEISFPMMRELLDELMPGEKIKCFEAAGKLLQIGHDALHRSEACLASENHSHGLEFPEDYPYMDEFEYIDHNI